MNLATLRTAPALVSCVEHGLDFLFAFHRIVRFVVDDFSELVFHVDFEPDEQWEVVLDKDHHYFLSPFAP